MPAFVAEIQHIFTATQIGDYIDHLERTKCLAPLDPALEIGTLDDVTKMQPWDENPFMGVEELLRFSRVQQLHPP